MLVNKSPNKIFKSVSIFILFSFKKLTVNKTNEKIIMVNKNESKTVNIIEVKKISEFDSFFFAIFIVVILPIFRFVIIAIVNAK
tara:strand:- start:1371 stop:1622 length:252 start_codon:yes stop_codon:yes gene_type:complete